MNPNTYQDATKTTEIYSDASRNFLLQYHFVSDGMEAPNTPDETALEEMLSLMYCVGKLNGEAGEVAELVFKAFRGDMVITDETKQKLFYELGDVMWYVARIADLAGHRLSDIMLANIEKLQGRQQRGTLHGYGDDR